ncbi:hypothetical protein SK128_009023 [Halocaridina rubra]|uniref:GIY-YIG domain-containing protein n=1 Tax=Halocaridina rubra TaxID=373956 RepID=A0AAN8ZYF1_HALRR
MGQTGRSLSQRVLEHKRAVRYNQENSALFTHVNEHNHRIDWSGATMLFKSTCQFKRKIVESSLIEMKDNFNLSRGQWTPDIIDKALLKRCLNEVIPQDKPPTRL